MPSKKIRLAVLGAGNMGTAVAQILAKNGHRVWLWDYNPATIQAIKADGENKQFLPGIKLSHNIIPEKSMQTAVEKSALVVLACASPYVRATTQHLAHCITPPTPPLNLRGGSGGVIIAHVIKGLEEKTFLTMHEVIQSVLPAILRRSVVTISGPSIAKEFVQGVPTAVVAASENSKARELVRHVFESRSFKVALSSDFRGVGICSALKNVYAIALGMCDGMRLTMNTKAFMATAALHEMSEVVKTAGGKSSTVHGLAGLGDMIVTGLGEGRNRALGERICREGSCKFVFKDKTHTFEGVGATRSFYEFARKHKIRAPLIQTVYDVLYCSVDPCKAVEIFFADARFD
ncbi:MAG: Glycerol-3-phosphate dehydrogenase [NAD(P)+] [Parcubacteria group bacterium GW2011_GWC2_45_7]|nr:MAG: Glycerol-3-phosphate dehydrogenase [NAD(P)+] [Parcubacteria group bacterium GW2011_GWC2_45_7]KKU73374.1 MAG: Glycerol-3-phosphate dehydrogenase [NAD(P)+] [Parcubacteria group bacterium GW2011_GWA2_47_26]